MQKHTKLKEHKLWLLRSQELQKEVKVSRDRYYANRGDKFLMYQYYSVYHKEIEAKRYATYYLNTSFKYQLYYGKHHGAYVHQYRLLSWYHAFLRPTLLKTKADAWDYAARYFIYKALWFRHRSYSYARAMNQWYNNWNSTKRSIAAAEKSYVNYPKIKVWKAKFLARKLEWQQAKARVGKAKSNRRRTLLSQYADAARKRLYTAQYKLNQYYSSPHYHEYYKGLSIYYDYMAKYVRLKAQNKFMTVPSKHLALRAQKWYELAHVKIYYGYYRRWRNYAYIRYMNASKHRYNSVVQQLKVGAKSRDLVNEKKWRERARVLKKKELALGRAYSQTPSNYAVLRQAKARLFTAAQYRVYEAHYLIKFYEDTRSPFYKKMAKYIGLASKEQEAVHNWVLAGKPYYLRLVKDMLNKKYHVHYYEAQIVRSNSYHNRRWRNHYRYQHSRLMTDIKNQERYVNKATIKKWLKIAQEQGDNSVRFKKLALKQKSWRLNTFVAYQGHGAWHAMKEAQLQVQIGCDRRVKHRNMWRIKYRQGIVKAYAVWGNYVLYLRPAILKIKYDYLMAEAHYNFYLYYSTYVNGSHYHRVNRVNHYKNSAKRFKKLYESKLKFVNHEQAKEWEGKYRELDEKVNKARKTYAKSQGNARAPAAAVLNRLEALKKAAEYWIRFSFDNRDRYAMLWAKGLTKKADFITYAEMHRREGGARALKQKEMAERRYKVFLDQAKFERMGNTVRGYWWHSFDRMGWSTCPRGTIVNSLYRNSCNSLYCLEEAKCVKPKLVKKPKCMIAKWASFDHRGWSRCPTGFYLAGVHRSRCTGLNCLEEARCCQLGEPTRVDAPEDSDMPISKHHSIRCRDVDWKNSMSKKGWSKCGKGEVISGFFRGRTNNLSGLEKAQCCKVVGAKNK
eukprot:TRINITY_DN241_c0_g1_i4.p1 TRINITY_DN241_c0_g1~~TRINITY_DN241_c0_g1_i4.p1  ORF type:complete len:900 (-),score=230.79 TRINITY_DN241_c0_g1_i4:79-2778(-)